MPKYSLMSLLDQTLRLLVAGLLMLTGTTLLLVLVVLLLVKVLICSLLMTLIPSKKLHWQQGILVFLIRSTSGILQVLASVCSLEDLL